MKALPKNELNHLSDFKNVSFETSTWVKQNPHFLEKKLFYISMKMEEVLPLMVNTLKMHLTQIFQFI